MILKFALTLWTGSLLLAGPSASAQEKDTYPTTGSVEWVASEPGGPPREPVGVIVNGGGVQPNWSSKDGLDPTVVLEYNSGGNWTVKITRKGKTCIGYLSVKPSILVGSSVEIPLFEEPGDVANTPQDPVIPKTPSCGKAVVKFDKQPSGDSTDSESQMHR